MAMYGIANPKIRVRFSFLSIKHNDINLELAFSNFLNYINKKINVFKTAINTI